VTTHPDHGNDSYTVAAIALLAMCMVTFDHEVLGHGGMCLAAGGHIQVVTSSVFRCSIHSVWIDPGGPFANILAGALPLLFIGRTGNPAPENSPTTPIRRSVPVICLSLGVYAVFVATLGRGLDF
jgi:hypothetical protein